MSLWSELKRRKVVQVAAVYAVTAWLLIQVIVSIEAPLNLPGWVDTLVIVLLALGFPIALILSWAFDVSPDGVRLTQTASATGAVGRAPSHWMTHVSQALVLLAVGFLVVNQYVLDNARLAAVDSDVGERQLERLSIVLPRVAAITFEWFPGRSLAISPDGTTIVYVASNMDAPASRRHLEMRTLDSLRTQTLAGTEAAAQPFFSPDGRWVAFFTNDGTLKKVPLAGGGAVPIVEDEDITGIANFGVWLESDDILFTTQASLTVWQVSANGGEVTASSIRGIPIDIVPGADTVLAIAVGPGGLAIEATRLDGGERHSIVENATFGNLLGDRLLFVRGDVLHVAPFDADRLLLTGPAVPLADTFRRDGRGSDGRVPQFAASRSGSVVYVPPFEPRTQLFLVSRDGVAEAVGRAPDLYRNIDVSPDGRYAALEVGPFAQSEVLIYDLERETTQMLTPGAYGFSPSWHPDGGALALSASGGAENGLLIKQINGNAQLLVPHTEPLQPVAASIHSPSWGAEGRIIAYTRQRALNMDIMTVDVAGDGEPQVLIGSAYLPQFSPDGRWLAYVGAAGQQAQVYVRRYPDGNDIVVSRGFGTSPRWNADGTELFFQGLDGGELAMLSVPVSGEDEPDLGPPAVLFPLRNLNDAGEIETYAITNNLGSLYDVLPDGRFLMSRGPDTTRQRELILLRGDYLEIAVTAQ